MVKLSEKEQEILNRVKKQTWFKSYERNHPKSKTKKILSKVKKGIKAGKYRKFEEYPTSRTDADNRGHIEPKPKKEKPEKQTMYSPVKKPAIKKNEKERSYTPQTKVRVEKARLKYPNATNYELRHGVNSKASQSYRQRNNLPEVR